MACDSLIVDDKSVAVVNRLTASQWSKLVIHRLAASCNKSENEELQHA